MTRSSGTHPGALWVATRVGNPFFSVIVMVLTSLHKNYSQMIKHDLYHTNSGMLIPAYDNGNTD